jgi:hypothetical protein
MGAKYKLIILQPVTYPNEAPRYSIINIRTEVVVSEHATLAEAKAALRQYERIEDRKAYHRQLDLERK